MSTDFDSDVVLANSARALRTEVLPTITDDHARRTLIQIIAVMEAHLDQLRAGPTTTNVDGGLLSAFGGRLVERDDRGD